MHDYLLNKKERDKKRRKRILTFAGIFFALAAVLTGLAYLARGENFLYETVQFSGDQSRAELITSAFRNISAQERGWLGSLVFQDNNLLGIRTGSVERKLAAALPIFKHIRLEKDYSGKTVTISAQEREKYALWCSRASLSEEAQSQETCYWFDSEGVLFLEGPSAAKGQLIYKIEDSIYGSAEPGSQIPIGRDLEMVKNIFLFIEKFDFPVRTLVTQRKELEEIRTAQTSSAPTVYFSLRQDPHYALATLNGIRSEVMKGEYIDLRVRNRIYYK